MTEEIWQIQGELEKILDEPRYRHTIGVMYTAGALAMRYQTNIEQAMLAGLLHDCAKSISNDKKTKECQEYGLPITDTEHKSPFLLHAKLGAYYAENRYGIKDEEILHAIRVHTTGSPRMNVLDKIIYIADYIEPGRNKVPRLELIRYTAFQDLNNCLKMILSDNLQYLKSKEFCIDPMTEETYQYYQKLEEEI